MLVAAVVGGSAPAFAVPSFVDAPFGDSLQLLPRTRSVNGPFFSKKVVGQKGFQGLSASYEHHGIAGGANR